MIKPLSELLLHLVVEVEALLSELIVRGFLAYDYEISLVGAFFQE
jgi:hypothetical protein